MAPAIGSRNFADLSRVSVALTHVGAAQAAGDRTGPRRLRRAAAWVVAGCASLLAACATLPSQEHRTASVAVTDIAGTRLGRQLATAIAAHPGASGIHDLSRPRDSFAARILLAGVADKSLDVQYYIWHLDESGELMFEALWNAAQRGVRVRVLLDDINTGGLDPTIAALDAHPNIEVRLYNPFVLRNARALAFVTDFTRVNRRMHNKSFTADNQASIVGGRNIGNEYFNVGHGVGFADWDVLAVGPVVQEISKAFDLYWNSASAYPAALLVRPPPDGASAELETRFEAARANPDAREYLESVRSTPLLDELLQGRLALEWTTARLVFDDPAKTLDTAERTDLLLFPTLVRSFGQVQRTLDLVSPYFVPGDRGAEALVALAERGVKVRILTNSLSATDTSVVHAGYAKHRRNLLRAGIQLFELKRLAKPQDRQRIGSSSSAALHAKSYAVDRSTIFIGSFNFDQRSAHLNTEMGVVIDSRALAEGLGNALDRAAGEIAYEVRLTRDGERLQWIERTATGEVVYDVDPETSWSLRTRVEMLSQLPIDWLL
jgi:putative cardiolipin synthase